MVPVFAACPDVIVFAVLHDCIAPIAEVSEVASVFISCYFHGFVRRSY